MGEVELADGDWSAAKGPWGSKRRRAVKMKDASRRENRGWRRGRSISAVSVDDDPAILIVVVVVVVTDDAAAAEPLCCLDSSSHSIGPRDDRIPFWLDFVSPSHALFLAISIGRYTSPIYSACSLVLQYCSKVLLHEC